jgi:Ca2+-binding RTX toxin-like protein
MGTYNYTGTAADNLIQIFNSQPSSGNTGNTCNVNGAGGNDTLVLNNIPAYTAANTHFLSSNFTIAPANASGVIVVSGASSGGDKFTFNLTSVETIAFSDKTVTLSYGPVDNTPPTVSSFSPADAATGVALASDVVLTFSEAIQKGTGAIELHAGSATGTVVESFDSATSTHLTFSGSTLTINPTADLVHSTHYFVTLAAGTVKDAAGNSYAGTTAYDFTALAPTMSAMSHNGVSVNPTVYSGPATAAGDQAIHFQLLGDTTNEVVQGTGNNDFINVSAGDDAVNAGAGNDVIDGGLGSNFLTGGAGSDIFFSDGRGGGTTWSTITDWQAGEQLSVWGWTPGVSKILLWQQDGAAGYQGLTMHADLDGNGTIDTSVTFTGITSQSQLPTPGEFANPALLWFH